MGGLHLIDAAVTDLHKGGSPATDLDRAVVLALRTARPILDRLDRAERNGVGGVLVSHPLAEAQRVGEIARRVAGGLSLGAGLVLPVAGLEGCGLFAALHIARAVLASCETTTALVVSLTERNAGAVLLARDGGTPCRPLPPIRVPLAPQGDAATEATLYGAGLALALETGGVRRRAVRRVVGPSLGAVEAAYIASEAGLGHALEPSPDCPLARAVTVEAAVAAAVQQPPTAPTLVWARSPGGHVSACLLGPT